MMAAGPLHRVRLLKGLALEIHLIAHHPEHLAPKLSDRRLPESSGHVNDTFRRN